MAACPAYGWIATNAGLGVWQALRGNDGDEDRWRTCNMDYGHFYKVPRGRSPKAKRREEMEKQENIEQQKEQETSAVPQTVPTVDVEKLHEKCDRKWKLLANQLKECLEELERLRLQNQKQKHASPLPQRGVKSKAPRSLFCKNCQSCISRADENSMDTRSSPGKLSYGDGETPRGESSPGRSSCESPGGSPGGKRVGTSGCCGSSRKESRASGRKSVFNICIRRSPSPTLDEEGEICEKAASTQHNQRKPERESTPSKMVGLKQGRSESRELSQPGRDAVEKHEKQAAKASRESSCGGIRFSPVACLGMESNSKTTKRPKKRWREPGADIKLQGRSDSRESSSRSRSQPKHAGASRESSCSRLSPLACFGLGSSRTSPDPKPESRREARNIGREKQQGRSGSRESSGSTARRRRRRRASSRESSCCSPVTWLGIGSSGSSPAPRSQQGRSEARNPGRIQQGRSNRESSRSRSSELVKRQRRARASSRESSCFSPCLGSNEPARRRRASSRESSCFSPVSCLLGGSKEGGQRRRRRRRQGSSESSRRSGSSQRSGSRESSGRSGSSRRRRRRPRSSRGSSCISFSPIACLGIGGRSRRGRSRSSRSSGSSRSSRSRSSREPMRRRRRHAKGASSSRGSSCGVRFSPIACPPAMGRMGSREPRSTSRSRETESRSGSGGSSRSSRRRRARGSRESSCSSIRFSPMACLGIGSQSKRRKKRWRKRVQVPLSGRQRKKQQASTGAGVLPASSKYNYYKYYGYAGQGAKTSWGHNYPLGLAPPYSVKA